MVTELDAVSVNGRSCEHWGLVSPASLVFERFDAATFCYDRKSGDTHLISPFPDELIRFLLIEPMSADELAKKICELCEDDYSTQWLERVNAALMELSKLGLVLKGP